MAGSTRDLYIVLGVMGAVPLFRMLTWKSKSIKVGVILGLSSTSADTLLCHVLKSAQKESTFVVQPAIILGIPRRLLSALVSYIAYCAEQSFIDREVRR
jgi:hypothetical protein